LSCQYKSPNQHHLPVQVELSLAAAPSPVIRSSLLLSNTLSEVLRSRPTNTDSTLYLQILRIIQATGQFVDDISARYFHGIHAFIPVVSRRRIHNHLVDFGAPPPASFSILLLTMCLITYHPEFASTDTESLDQETLYLATKTLFAQVQASLPPSLDLIQAGIIISTYEYASGKTHDAFASIGFCARMGYTARLHLATPVQGMNAEVYRKAQEDANTWWGIVICER
jgi:Fungal specific transcription factor domain